MVAMIETLLDRNSVLMQRRALGPAIVRDMIGHIGERYGRGEGRHPEPVGRSVPALRRAAARRAGPHCDPGDPQAAEELFGTAAEEKRLLKRIADLYPFVILRVTLMVNASSVTLDEAAVLRRLVELSLDARAADLLLASAPDVALRGLAATLFLLDEEAGRTCCAF